VTTEVRRRLDAHDRLFHLIKPLGDVVLKLQLSGRRIPHDYVRGRGFVLGFILAFVFLAAIGKAKGVQAGTSLVDSPSSLHSSL
jgi:hypothetical protein